MACEMNWSHSFCLGCDRQTEGSVYCSEVCRLADYEDAAGLSSVNSSPSSQMSFEWSKKTQTSRASSIKSNNSNNNIASYHRNSSSPSIHSSSSQSTLSEATKTSKTSTVPSSQSESWSNRGSQAYSATDTSQLSEESRRALRIYANSFDQSRYNRRQSGN